MDEASLLPADAVILAVAHARLRRGRLAARLRLLKGGKGIVMDVKAKLDRAAEAGRRDALAPVMILRSGCALENEKAPDFGGLFRFWRCRDATRDTHDSEAPGSL